MSDKKLTAGENAAEQLLLTIENELRDKIKKEIEGKRFEIWERVMETLQIQTERQSTALESIAKTLTSLEAEVARHFLKNDV